jgi:hypothetical protein
VARAAIDGQLRAIDAILNQPSPAAAAATIARVAVRHENTRVIMAMAQSADQEATLRSLFRELADGIVTRGRASRRSWRRSDWEAQIVIHALSVGLAVIDLATARKDGERRARRALQEMLDLLLAANADLRTAKDIGALQDK